jgi:hypothetical protein
MFMSDGFQHATLINITKSCHKADHPLSSNHPKFLQSPLLDLGEEKNRREEIMMIQGKNVFSDHQVDYHNVHGGFLMQSVMASAGSNRGKSLSSCEERREGSKPEMVGQKEACHQKSGLGHQRSKSVSCF